MDELIGWFLVVAVVGAIAVFVIWIVAALLVRALSYVIVFWGVTLLGALLVGAVVGVVRPILVLLAKRIPSELQITPDHLTQGEVIKRKPRSPNAEYGWDSAWPNYMPYQALNDAKGVNGEARQHLGNFWGWFTSKVAGKGTTPKADDTPPKGKGTGRKISASGRAVPKLLWVALIFPTFFGYFLGVWISTLTWLIVMSILGLGVTMVQWVLLGCYALFDIGDRRRLRASVKCTHCYGRSHLPGYRCSNPGCDVIHWTMLPGPLGLFTRRCSCGTQLPNTVSSAARKLTPVCPYCQRDLATGSGGRQTIQIGLIGSIGAGKSLFLEASITELARVLGDVDGTIAPLNEDANAFFQQAVTRRQQRAMTQKTPYRAPVGLPFLVQKEKTAVELQVLDVAGEAFASWDEASNLRYLDTADGIILVLDPLALPEIHDHLRRSPCANSVLLATGDQEEAYGAAIDRLRAESIPLEKRGLAVVLTKGDVLMQLPVASSIDVNDSASIRTWLMDNGSDLMVRRFEKDFRDVRFFVVDSMWEQDTNTTMNPWWVIDWLLAEAKSPLKLGQAVLAPLAAEPASETTPTADTAEKATR